MVSPIPTVTPSAGADAGGSSGIPCWSGSSPAGRVTWTGTFATEPIATDFPGGLNSTVIVRIVITSMAAHDSGSAEAAGVSVIATATTAIRRTTVLRSAFIAPPGLHAREVEQG